MNELKQYRAFLSYSHKDSQLAKKLHRALENYRPPKSVTAKTKRSLGPIFRDEDELEAASNLSDRIKTALAQSEYLIILASPDAKASKWVNDEIRFFRDMKGDANILCALIHSDPNTSFPEALLETGHEPLAADLTSKNFRLGVTQLAAPMLDVSLDDLIQRDLRKMRRRVTAITVSACLAMIVMGSLTWAAISARQEAEQRRQIAEEQIEFMITDLKDDLKTVGRLDALESVAQRAYDYYEAYPLSTHDDDALGRRARVFHMLGSVQELEGNLQEANKYFERAYDATEALLKKSPNNPERIFEQSQSAFYIGSRFFRIANYDQAEEYFLAYRDYIDQLASVEGETPRVQKERIYTLSNLSSVYLKTGEFKRLSKNLENEISVKKSYLDQSPNDISRRSKLAKSYRDYASLKVQQGDIENAIYNLNNAISILETEIKSSINFTIEQEKLITIHSLATTQFFAGNIKGAKESLIKAKKKSNELISIEPENIDILYEDILINILEFHIAYIEANLDVAEIKISEIYRKINNESYFEKNDNKLITLQSAYTPLPLYLAILKRNVKEIKTEAHKLEAKTLKNAFNISSTGRLSDLSLYHLLSLYILEKTETADKLISFCNSENINLTFQEKSAFSTVFENKNCPIVSFDIAHPTTSFRITINRYDTLHLE